MTIPIALSKLVRMSESLAIANSYILVRLVNRYYHGSFLQVSHGHNSILEYLWHIHLRIDKISSLKGSLHLQPQAG